MAKKGDTRRLPKPTLNEILVQMALPGVLGTIIYVWSWRSFNDDVSVLDSLFDGLVFFIVWTILQILIHRKRIFQ
jgi:hypothetical protein